MAALRRARGLVYVLFRLGVELFLAHGTAEVKRLPVVLGLSRSGGAVDIHAAHMIFYSGCARHREFSFFLSVTSFPSPLSRGLFSIAHRDRSARTEFLFLVPHFCHLFGRSGVVALALVFDFALVLEVPFRATRGIPSPRKLVMPLQRFFNQQSIFCCTTAAGATARLTNPAVFPHKSVLSRTLSSEISSQFLLTN
jgi:hypothetical protein